MSYHSPGDVLGLGYLQFRDHRDGFKINRNVIAGMRVVDDSPSVLGDWPGFADNWTWWKDSTFVRTGRGFQLEDYQSPRGVPKWLAAVGMVSIQSSGGSRSSYPMFDARTLDGRFIPLTDKTSGGFTGDGSDSYQIANGRYIPDGTPMIMLPGTNDGALRNTAFPLMEMVAENDVDKIKFSTPIYKITGSSLDQGKAGGLHSVFRITQIGDVFNEADGLWQPSLNFTSGGDFSGSVSTNNDWTGYGLITSRGRPFPDYGTQLWSSAATGSYTSTGHNPGRGLSTNQIPNYGPRDNIEMSKLTNAYLSWEKGGPIIPGNAFNDQHRFGINKKGERLNSAHLWTKAQYYWDYRKDGPLYFENGDFPDLINGPFCMPVHLKFNPDRRHPWMGGLKRGKWEWYATSSWLYPNIELNTSNSNPPPPPTGEWPPMANNPGGPGGPESDTVGICTGVINDITGKYWDDHAGMIGDNGLTNPELPTVTNNWDAGEPTPQSDLRALSSPFEMSTPSQLFSAIRWKDLQPYDGRFGASPRDRQVWADLAPLTIHIEGFGSYGDEGWQYRTNPDTIYQYGTTQGGVTVSPPERVKDGDYTLAGTEVTYWAFNQVRLAFGDSDLDTDGAAIIPSGHYFEYDSSNEILKLWATDSDGDTEDAGVQFNVNGITRTGDITNSDYTEFESDGFMEASGDAIAYRDLYVPGSSAKTGGSSAPLFQPIDLEVGSGNLYGYVFDNRDKYLYSTGVELDHDYVEGGNLEIHIHWTIMDDPDTIADDQIVELEVEVGCMDSNDTYQNDTVTQQVDVVDLDKDDRIYTTMTTFTGATTFDTSDLKIGDQLILRYGRNNVRTTGDITAYEGNICILGMGVHIPVNTLGSRELLTK